MINNYVVGTQHGDIYAGKVANSLSLGLFSFIYFALKYKKSGSICNLLCSTPNHINQLKHNLFTSEIQNRKTADLKEIVKAVLVSMICGLLNAVGMVFLYIAFQSAGSHGYNISICMAILSGNCIFALLASFTVFNDKVTLFESLGVFLNLGGVLTISLGQGSSGVTTTMVIGSALSATCLGIRILLSKYCCNRIDSIVFMNLNFIADFLFGLIWLIIFFIGWYKFNFELSSQAVVFFSGVFAA